MLTLAPTDPPPAWARPAAGDDYEAFARLYPELATGDPIPLRAVWERDIAPGSVVAEGDEGIVGYVFFEAFPALGFVRNLVVAPEARGRGVGKLLLEASREILRARGLRRWALHVKRANRPAIVLYERAGFAPSHDTPVLRTDWGILERLPREALEVDAARFDPEDAPPIERALSLFEGELASPASQTGRLAFVLFERGAPEHILGAAVFAPTFPGVRPFRVVRPTLAAPLLEALAPHRDLEKTYLQIVLGDDRALQTALISAGAALHLDIVLYEADL